jgi:hypothetical protein
MENTEKKEVETLDALIGELKEHDQQDRKALRYIMIMFCALFTVYIAGMNLQKGIMKDGYALLAGGFALSLVFFLLKFLRQRRISYTDPVLVFLKNAEVRYTFWPLTEMIVSVPLLLLMGFGGGVIVYGSMNKYFPGSPAPLVIYAIIYLAAIGVGSWAARKLWVKNKKPVFDKIRRLRQEFGE